MKVVQINAVYGVNSTGRTMKEMHEFCKSCGIESHNFYSTPNSDSDRYEIIGNRIDHKIHAFFSRLFGKQAYFSHVPTFNLVRKLKRITPDIVILRVFHSNYINLPILLNYLSGKDIPTIIVLHDCWFMTGHCCHYTEAGCDKWKYECNHCPEIHGHNESWFFDNSRSIFRNKYSLYHSIPRLAVVGVSDWITNEAKQSPLFSGAKIIRRIYNWIDLYKFYPRDVSVLRGKLKFESNEFIALGVSMQWSNLKGLNTYLEVARLLPELKIIMIGNMPEGMKLPSNIINIKQTDSTEELAQYYSLANVLFNFSIQETFGKVSAEALACGTPLIVNNTTANPELPGDCGYFVENNNTNQIICAIRQLQKEDYSILRKKCVDRANSLFEKNKNLGQYIELFNELTSKNYEEKNKD